ncbi:MAG: hypothetical protein ACYTEG_02520 [Planctomycetota bacterium]
MRKPWMLGCLFTLSVLVLACGGGSGDGGSNPPVANLQALTTQLQTCALVRTGDLSRILALLQPLFDAAADEEAAAEWEITIEASTDAGDPPNTYTYSIPFDLDGDGSKDAEMAGKITFDRDPTEGVPPGMVADLTWNLTAAGGDVTGSGALHVVLGEAGAMQVSGNGSISDAPTGCSFEFVVDEAAPLIIGPFPIAEPLRADPSLAIELPIGSSLEGCAEIVLSMAGNEYAGEVCFAEEEICITNATINSRRVADQCFSPLPQTDPEFVQLVACATGQVYILGGLIEAAELVMLEYNDVPTSANITFPDPTDFLKFNFTVNVDLDGDLTSERVQGDVDIGTGRLVWEIPAGTLKGSYGNFYLLYSLYDWDNPSAGGLMTVSSAFCEIRTAAGCSLLLSIVQGGDAPDPLSIEFDSSLGITDVYGGIDRFVVNGASLVLNFRPSSEWVGVWLSTSPGESFLLTIPGS